MPKINLLYNTVKYLKFKQVFYRVYYTLRNKFYNKNYTEELPKDYKKISWTNYLFYNKTYLGDQEFNYLNKTNQFSSNINWNYSEYGKLWTYNLTYFDFLNQRDLKVDEGLKFMHDFLSNNDQLKDALEPYPISLRGINWVKFLSENKLQEIKLDQLLYNHYQQLYNNLEYHLLGNHLLENAFSLLFGAYYFQDKKLLIKADKLLRQELNEQVLSDGAHFELSPMYHQILLHRLLDCIALIQQNDWGNNYLLEFLIERAQCMLSWLKQVTYANGDIPMVNDSAFNIALHSKDLFDYATHLNIKPVSKPLSASGYRKWNKKEFELFIDVGAVGPSYQPGHAHSDTFSFELYVNNQPVIVDTGTSTYEKNELRQNERSTCMHNTVQLANADQTQVWGGFRVANRAEIVALEETEEKVKATHNGYKKMGINHTRTFEVSENAITISDSFSSNKVVDKRAFLHFHSRINDIQVMNNEVIIPQHNLSIVFENLKGDIEKESFDLANGFNRRVKSSKICVRFESDLKTKISTLKK